MVHLRITLHYDCRLQTHCISNISVSSTACKATSTKVSCYPLPFPWPHLGLGSQPRWTYAHIPGCVAPVGTHPGMPIIVMGGEMWCMMSVTHGDSWLSNLNSACGHQPKGAAVLWRWYLEEDKQHSWAVMRWFMCAPTGACQVITETNALNTVEGSRLLWQGSTRHVNTSAATTSDHLKVSGGRTPSHVTPSIYTKWSHDLGHLHGPWHH